MLSDAVVSLIRTWVPIIVGVVGAWLLSKGVEIDTADAAMLLTGVLSSAYYAAARALESRWPKLGILLGVSKKPTY